MKELRPLTRKNELLVIWMFLRRAFLMQTHFKFSYLIGLLGTVSTLVMYGMIARFGANVSEIGSLSGGYINYVITGLVINTLLATAMSGPYRGLMDCFWSNRAETLMASPIRLQIFATGISSGHYLDTFIRVSIYLLGGWLFLGFTWPAASGLILCVLLLALGLVACSGLGLAAASMIYLLDARGGQDPIQFFVEAVSGLVAGVYFPFSVLPAGIQWLAYLIPHTYAIDGIRRALYGISSIPLLSIHESIGFNPILLDALVLVLYGVISVPVGWRLFLRGIDLARTDGRLSRWL
jgi:ABC-2 type transport system permease protein